MFNKRIGFMVIALGVMLALVVFPVAAHPAVQAVVPDTSSLVNFLLFLTSGSGLAMVLSFVQARSAWFQKLEANAKMVVTLGLCTLIPAAAFLIVTYTPAALLAALDPLFKVLATGLTMFLGNQVYHGMNKPPSTPPAIP